MNLSIFQSSNNITINKVDYEKRNLIFLRFYYRVTTVYFLDLYIFPFLLLKVYTQIKIEGTLVDVIIMLHTIRRRKKYRYGYIVCTYVNESKNLFF